MVNMPLAGLAIAGGRPTQREGRNANLNDAYQPPWDQTDAMQLASTADFMPQGDTRIDPFQGTQWGRWLDTLPPGGIRPARGRGDPLSGLRTATPMPPMGQIQS